ncbi:hypothetical protein AYK24_09130 [Thermoplasmatales archaeon SG8-52-4]|nr:MAG: hypothetical protein AYK24_09130 [Thermoplasmatales archaeon SG8-52-4]
MNKKMICLIFCTILLICSTFTIASSEKLNLNFISNPIGVEIKGNTLIVENINKRVFEVDTLGTLLWQKTGLSSPYDAERLDNGNTLIAQYSSNKIIELDSSGNIVWEHTGVSGPQDVERLDNGNTLITETLGSRVIEIDNFGNIIWQKTGLFWPTDAERIDNGNTLITEGLGNRLIEVDNNGDIIWDFTNLSNPVDVELLSDGTLLITEANRGQVIIIDSWGGTVRKITGLDSPWDAEWLSNGDILIAEFANERIFQIQPDDEIVWEITNLQGPVDVERLPNLPPSPPEIIGPSVGKMFVPLYFNFTSTDINADRVTYLVNWGDGTTNNWSPWQNSGEYYCENHTWYIPVNYTILAKAKDNYGSESEWSTFQILIPRNRKIVTWYERFIDRFPILSELINIFLKL